MEGVELNFPPMSTLDDIQKKAQEQFDRQSANYGKNHILSNVSDVQDALRGIPFHKGMRALDIGTGGGHTALYLAGAGYVVTAADLSEGMLHATLQLAQERGLCLQTKQHAAEELPYADESFDLVTCRVAAHHFSSPEQFVHEVARVLKKSGYFILIDGSVEDDEPEAEEWIHQVEKFRDPSHHRFLSPGAWRILCTHAGLDVGRAELSPFKQPDLEWYFQTANTSPENRKAVLALVQDAPESVKRIYHLATEDGKIIWYWSRLTLVAKK